MKMTNNLYKKQIKTVGTIGELRAIIQLLERRFSVFQNVNDIDGKDFIIEKDGIYKSLQIKTSESFTNNRYTFRYGNNGNCADFTIAIAEKDFYIIPKEDAPNTGINIRKTHKCKYNKYKNAWRLLDGNCENEFKTISDYN